MKNLLLSISLLVAGSATAQVAHFDMSPNAEGRITESVSGASYAVEGRTGAQSAPGAIGQALRLDGYTTHVNARLGNILPATATQLTFSIWCALPCYPIIEIDVPNTEQVPLASCLDSDAKNGFGFYIGYDGSYSFKTYVGGWAVNVAATENLPTNEWCHLVAVVDGGAKTVTLYRNGEVVGSGRCNGAVSFAANCPLRIGQGQTSRKSGPFELLNWCGIIDDIDIYDSAWTAEQVSSTCAEKPQLSVPAEQWANDLLRPHFHGMPSAGWTNECHGMTFSDGRYHLFFQKNANGPYMARLNWGHISSDNLYLWQEEPIAIAPGESYDIKGCWSGCVFSDPAITGELPGAIYTGVDYAKASIDFAMPQDASLLTWQKQGQLIPQRPDGLSDDFRDPYFFRNGDNAYIIVGTSRDGKGACTLHKYNASTKTWSNTAGDIFFRATNTAQGGTFWEMPNITPMNDGQWLFTCTPQNTSVGVRTIYWTGTLDRNGKFVADDAAPKGMEMTSRDGFGLLSPTIYTNPQGETIALGIVPDKLPSQDNWNLGWAHCYSLPRLLSLDTDGTLIQKPYPGMRSMRAEGGYERQEFTLNGQQPLSEADGRQAEVLARFTVGTATVGLRVFDNGSAAGIISYNPANGTLTADFSQLQRLHNDNGVYNGVYNMSLPRLPRAGEEMTINLFIDGSIVDIFVNERYAQSIRVFPTASDANGISAFSNGGDTHFRSLQAWRLDPGRQAAITDIFTDTESSFDPSAPVEYFNLQGQRVMEPVSGLYIRRQGGKATKIIL